MSLMKAGCIFEQNAIQFLAMKVSSYSGDIRRCLQVAKRALEITRDKYQALLRINPQAKMINVSYQDV